MSTETQEQAGRKILEVHASGDVDKERREHVEPTKAGQFGACAVAEFASLEKAENAMRALPGAAFPQNQISVVVSHPKRKLHPTPEKEFGGDSATDSAIGAGLGGVLGYLGGTVVTLITGVGTVFLIGPIAGLFAGATLGALIGAFEGVGVGHEHLSRYEQSVKNGKVLVIAHGNPQEADKAGRFLTDAGGAEVHLHTRAGSTGR